MLPAGDNLDASTPILALRRSFAELQHAVLAVARTAGRLGIPVDAACMSHREPAVRSRYIRRTLELPEQADERQWLDALLRFGDGARPQLLLALDDAAALFVETHHDALTDAFLLPDAPPGIYRRLSNKRALHEICGEIGLASPACRFPTSAVEALEYAAEFGYPVVVKRAEWWLATHDPVAPSVAIARDSRQLLRAYDAMESPERPQLMIQEYIPGGSDSVWMFNGHFGRDSECVFGYTGQKLRQRGPHAGPTTLGICVWNQRVVDAATLLARELGFRGIIDMGLRYDARDGEYKVLDVNPRLGSTFRLFAAPSGLDVVRAAYLELTGQPVRPEQPREGRKWIVEPYDLISSAQLAREGMLPIGAWLRSLRDVEEAAWWARDDPMPFLTMASSLGFAGARYRARRRRLAQFVDEAPETELVSQPPS